MQRLEAEQKEINLDHERRDKEWAELNDSIEELKVQREKLEKQRQLLHADRQEILGQIAKLKKLQDLKALPYRIRVTEIEECESDSQKHSRQYVKSRTNRQDSVLKNDGGEIAAINFDTSNKKEISNGSPPFSAPFGFLKRCASSFLEQTQSNKKQKQQKDSKQSDDSFTLPGLSSILNNLDNGNGTSVVSTKETTVYIDKIIKVREVTSVSPANAIENTQGSYDTNQFVNQKLKGQAQE